jgi:CubicO group peptidase (beta-lactamase class C family)
MRAHRFFCLAILFVLFFSSYICAQINTRAFDEYLTSMNKTEKFSGSVLVAINDSVIFNKGYGDANYEWSVPNTSDTKFNIGSMTKQFTTVMILQLEQEGKLKLDDFISKYLPDYRKDIGGKVTIDHLLRHTSGIPCYIRDYKRKPGDDLLFSFPYWNQFTKEFLIANYMSGDLLFEPGTEYRYSNTNFYLLNLIMEKITSKTYKENLQERILDPLGMNDSGLLDNFTVIYQIADGYVNTPTGIIKAKHNYEPNFYGTGGNYSTTGDLFKWNRTLHTGNFLPASIREKMFTPYWKEGGYVQHGYSVDFYTMRLPGKPEPVKYTSFNGAIQGFISDVICFEDDGITITILDNSDQFNHTRIAGNIYKLLKNQDVAPPKPALSTFITRTAIEKGIDSAVSEYYKILDENSDQYEVNSLSGLSWTAFIYADAGMNKEAMTLLKLNTILHPHSAEAYNDFADFLEHIKSADALGMRAKANEIKLVEKKLYGYISKSEFDEAMKMVETAKKDFPRPDVFESYKIGPIFEQFMGEGKTNEAIQVCKLWAKGNSADVGPYFSMARIYEKTGNNDEAVKCYEKIIQIAPTGRSTETAKNRLEELKKK